MAYLFDATGEYITLGFAQFPQAAGTLAIWARNDFDKDDNVDHFLFDLRNADVSATSAFIVIKTSGNDFLVGWKENSINYYATAAAGTFALAQGEWHSIIVTWNDPGAFTFFYIDGVSEATNFALTTWNSNGRRKYLGNWVTQSLDWRGAVAEVAIWPRVLTAGERSVLDAGYAPSLVPGGYGDNWWPLIRELGDPWGHQVPTVAGATVTPHPRVLYGGRPYVGKHRIRVPWHLLNRVA